MKSKQQTVLKEKFSIEIFYSLCLIIICILYANGIIPTEFYSDDFIFMTKAQEKGSLIKNAFDTEPLASSYYRPILTLIWGICYKLFGLWAPGYNIIELLLFIGIIIFYYKSVSLLTNYTISFIASLFLLLHAAAPLLSFLATISTISGFFFLWFTIYFIIRNNVSSRNTNLFFAVCGTVLAVLSYETTYLPLLVILFYYAVLERPGKKFHSYVYGLLITFIFLMMIIGPSGVFRLREGHGNANILINFPIHFINIFYSGLPILAIPFLFSIVAYVRDMNIFKSFALYILSAVVLLVPAILKIYGHQIPETYVSKHIDAYLIVFTICILILIWRKYLYEFLINLVNNKALIWYVLFIFTFAPILSFYVRSPWYTNFPFSFISTALAVTYFIWSDKIRTVLLNEYNDFKSMKNVFSMKLICIIMIYSTLVLNSCMVVIDGLREREHYMLKTEKENRKVRSAFLENLADYLINNSKSNSLIVSKRNINFSDNYNFSHNSLFLFIYIRHKNNNFNIIFDPDAQIKDYNSDFISKLELLGLDSKISFDPETEKYIMEKVGENPLTKY